jgi:lipoyl(octanoyl) transferase
LCPGLSHEASRFAGTLFIRLPADRGRAFDNYSSDYFGIVTGSLTDFMAIDWEAFTNHTLTTAEVRLLGMVDVPSVLALQKLMVHEVRLQSRTNAAILICEHPPTVTVGEGATLLELPASPRELESRLIAVHKLHRDGHAILHQPGQLAAYIVVSLPECSMSVDEYRSCLQRAIVKTCEEVQVVASIQPSDPTAVLGRHGVVAEIGIHVDNGVTSFGIFLNVSPRLDEAREIGRGMLGQKVSSLNAERVRPTQMPQVRSALIQHLCEELGYPDYHLHTGHPFLKRTRTLIHDKFANPQSADE